MSASRSRSLARRGPLRVAMLAYPDAQVLDITGPLEVFARASRWLVDQRWRRHDSYRVELVAPAAGPLRTSSGLELVARASCRGFRGPVDTLLVAGGIGTPAALEDRALVRWVARQAARARRVAAVCTGAFVLAEAGLLAGRRATTHWAWCERLARRHPDVRVEPDRIWVKDGVYTSAGVTAGMDLALALVEEDLGREVALAVARQLVLFLKRPGGQSQFSSQLAHPLARRDGLREVQAWVAQHPEADLSVPALAQRAGMSPRNFARQFVRQVGVTPSQFVGRARLETARRLLEDSGASLDAVAAAAGFGTAESMRRVFQRDLGVAPHAYRQRFARAEVRS